MRLLSYFRDQDGKTAALMEQVRRIDYVVTSNGFEALLLEINLIKQWMPRYNVDLKDGKSYPVVRVTAEEYPRVVKTRTIIKDGSRYYGPYIEVRNLVEAAWRSWGGCIRCGNAAGACGRASTLVCTITSGGVRPRVRGRSVRQSTWSASKRSRMF